MTNNLPVEPVYLTSALTPRAEIELRYTAHNGIIVSPGKFEGCPIYIPYYWDLMMSGCYDADDGNKAIFMLADGITNDNEMWPELAGYGLLILWEDTNGFVHFALVPKGGSRHG